MLVRINGHLDVEVEEKYLEYSPYLRSAMDTGRKMLDTDFINLDFRNEEDEMVVSNDTVLNYLEFIQGNSFTMDEEDEQFFDFMGHINRLKYPTNYWRMKLKSKWTRDNFYRLKLAERDNGLYGLISIPIINQPDILVKTYDKSPSLESLSIDTERDGIVIAGGAALWVGGYIGTCSDVDMFSIDKEKSLTFFRAGLPDKDIEDRRTKKNRKKEESYKIDILRNSYAREGQMGWASKITLIRRLYTCPSEVVHGFDLDVCQFVLVYKDGTPSLYATEIGLYAAQTGEQWYDPEMVSTSYIERLAKYQRRGIAVRLPIISRLDLHTHITVGSKRKTPSLMLKSIPVQQSQRDMKKIVAEMDIPRDIGSILIYISLFRESRPTLIRALLNPEVRDWKEYDQELEGIADPWDLSWIEIDPMQQAILSGIMYPIDIDDIEDLYRKSPLHKGSNEPIVYNVFRYRPFDRKVDKIVSRRNGYPAQAFYPTMDNDLADL